jgi:hypothetical protein
MALLAHSGPRPFIQFRNCVLKMVGLLGRMMSTSQGGYLNTGQHKHIHVSNIHALSGIRTHAPRVGVNKNSSCLTPRGYCDRRLKKYNLYIWEREVIKRCKCLLA